MGGHNAQGAGQACVHRRLEILTHPPLHDNHSYYCVGEIAGADSDVTVWEFGMMGGTTGDMEQWLRSSFLLPKQPHVLLCDTMEGARDTRNGPLEKRTDRE